jgi:hypothetical protein
MPDNSIILQQTGTESGTSTNMVIPIDVDLANILVAWPSLTSSTRIAVL